MTHPASSHAASPFAPGPWREIAETGRSVLAALAIAAAFQTALFQPFTISSSSMEPGLVTGDYVVISKYAYGWSRASLPFDPPLPGGRVLGRAPDRGDVVMFRLPRDRQETWVKRVIGLPGDRVQVRDGTVFVNGIGVARTPLGLVQDHDHPERTVLQMRETLADGRSYLTYDAAPDHEGDDAGVYVVPQDRYLVMGDNRDNSLDGRWPAEVGVGFLPAENLVGRAEIVVASWRPGAALLKPWTWLDLQTDRFLRPVR